jgi:hypothetical protein
VRRQWRTGSGPKDTPLRVRVHDGELEVHGSARTRAARPRLGLEPLRSRRNATSAPGGTARRCVVACFFFFGVKAMAWERARARDEAWIHRSTTSTWLGVWHGGRLAQRRSGWVGDGVVAGLTKMATRLGEDVLIPGFGALLLSPRWHLGVPAPTNGPRRSGSRLRLRGAPAKAKRASGSVPLLFFPSPFSHSLTAANKGLGKRKPKWGWWLGRLAFGSLPSFEARRHEAGHEIPPLPRFDRQGRWCGARSAAHSISQRGATRG